jgi:hypothetical protein
VIPRGAGCELRRADYRLQLAGSPPSTYPAGRGRGIVGGTNGEGDRSPSLSLSPHPRHFLAGIELDQS